MPPLAPNAMQFMTAAAQAKSRIIVTFNILETAVAQSATSASNKYLMPYSTISLYLESPFRS